MLKLKCLRAPHGFQLIIGGYQFGGFWNPKDYTFDLISTRAGGSWFVLRL